MNQRDILAALEDFVLIHSNVCVPDRFKNYPYFIQKLYSADILTETGILKHYNSKKSESEGRPSYAKAKVAAKPFLDWLQQNDSEEDSDENDEDGVETKTLGATAPVVGVQQSAVTSIKATDTA